MSQIDAEENILSEAEAGQRSGDSDSVKLVPVMESIRYRKRAQSAEKKAEIMSEQLAQAKSQISELSEQLSDIRTEQKLMRKLVAAGVVDLETAVLIAKARLQSEEQADINSVIERLRKEKQYLFADNSGVVTRTKTAGAKERVTSSQAILERVAKRAATTGSRADLQEYLKLRRNFL